MSIGPWGLCSYSPRLDLGQRSNAGYVALNFIWYWQYTQDAAWLKATGYPYLREVAGFWEDYLKFENGRYVIHNDAIHEGSGDNMNPILSLGLVRTLFANMLTMSRELGVDAEKRAQWQDILDKLSAYPLQERGGKTVFRYSEKGMRGGTATRSASSTSSRPAPSASTAIQSCSTSAMTRSTH